MSIYKAFKFLVFSSLSLFCLLIIGCTAPETKTKKEVASADSKESALAESEKNQKNTPVAATEYQELKIEGWTVFISAAVQNDTTLYQPIIDQLHLDLKGVKNVVPVHILPKLQKTKIWSEKSMPINKLNSLFFNGSRKLTEKYGLVPESYGGVILGKTKAYLAVADIKPWGMLHELTHAYHQFNIKHNFAPINLAFENTKQLDLHNPKTDKRINGSGYPTRNKREYFSELTVAYFAKKLFYPHDRTELAEYDSLGYCAVVKAWGLQGKQQGEIPLTCNQ